MSVFRSAWWVVALSLVPVLACATPQARVIVKLKADSTLLATSDSLAHAQSLGAGASSMSFKSGRMQRLGGRMGLSVQDGRLLGARTQLATASGMTSEALAARLAKQPDVEYAVVDHLRFRESVPTNDPLFGASPSLAAGQWYLYAPDATLPAAINAVGAWGLTTGSSRVAVAVLDTGIRSDHEDFSGKFLPGYNMISDPLRAGNTVGRTPDASDNGDYLTQAEITANPISYPANTCTQDLTSSWHGMEVAGIVGAATNNGIGMASVGRDTSILPVRVLGKCGGYDTDIMDAMKWAAGLAVTGVSGEVPQPRARVINLSLGSSGACGAYQDVINAVLARGVVVVASAGNTSREVDAPANCSGVIAVGALRQEGTKAGYSAAGPEISISAPGGNCVDSGTNCLYPILSASNSGPQNPVSNADGGSTYSSGLGTSFSAPMVSGTVALMLAIRPNLTPDAVKRILMRSARAFPTSGVVSATSTCHAPDPNVDQLECYCTTTTCGAGMLDTAEAVRQAASDGVASISVSPSQPVAGATLVLSGASSIPSALADHIVSYQWALVDGGGIVSALQGDLSSASVSATPQAAGQFQVRLTVTDNLNVSATSTQTITVQVAPPSGGGGGGGGALDDLTLWLGGAWVLCLMSLRQNKGRVSV